MSTVLDEIVLVKKKTLEVAKQKRALKDLAKDCEKLPAGPSFSASIRRAGELTVIAEMKQKSPSAGKILEKYDPSAIAKTYEAAGARAISVLTEENYFSGRPEHLQEVKRATQLPVLRKDFTVDPFQIYEARALGASAVLLIAAILTPKLLAKFQKLAQELGLEALVEVHTKTELETALEQDAKLIGINNRNLKDFSVDLGTTFRLLRKIPKETLVVSESGIRSPENIRDLKAAGVHSALIGEFILKSPDPAGALGELVRAGAKN